jgi:3-phosphoshikimate 1-carboxyvinyltransferase
VTDGIHEVQPVEAPVDVSVRLPGSKSETIRALAVAALADGRSHIYNGLAADDPVAMAGALEAFGISVNTSADPWAVDGGDGHLDPPRGPIDVLESGLTARIILAIAASTDGVTEITGRGRLPERPVRGLLESLRGLGVEIDGDHLPLTVTGRGHLWGDSVVVDCSETSQFATALMLVAPTMHEPCRLEIQGLRGSAGYLEVTAAMMRRFGAEVSRTVTGYEIANSGYLATDVVIEPDASAAVYPMVAAAVTGGRVRIEGLGEDSRQPDMRVAHVLGEMGCDVDWERNTVTVDATNHALGGIEVNLADAPDGAMAVAVAALFAEGPTRIGGLESLRLKESDRLAALGDEMTRLGADVTVEGESLVIVPTELTGAEVSSHGDHRIAMTMALTGLVVEGVSVSGAGAVAKTWPGYWEFLDGLG